MNNDPAGREGLEGGLSSARMRSHTSDVNIEDERRAMDEIADRLRQRYPAVTDLTVKTVVDASYHDLDNARIRSFVGILVEKQAAERLASYSR